MTQRVTGRWQVVVFCSDRSPYIETWTWFGNEGAETRARRRGEAICQHGYWKGNRLVMPRSITMIVVRPEPTEE